MADVTGADSVSIITAVRNGARDIGSTLESVAQQTHANLEHVIIDGASQDDTLEVVRRYPARLGAVISERDKGVYDAFNKGLRHAKGEWLGFLGAGDTFAKPDVVGRLVAAALAAGSELAYSDIVIIDPVTGRAERRYSSANFSRSRIRDGFMPAHPSMLMRRSIYERFGEFDTSYRIAGDFEYVARIFAKGPIASSYISEQLVHMQSGGLSNRGWKSKWRITQEMYRSCLAHGHDTSWLRLLARFPAKYVREMLGAGTKQ